MLYLKVRILLSGGIDSMVCLSFYLNKGYDVECLFCDYGQPAAEQEYKAAKSITEYFDVKLHFLKTNSIIVPEIGEIYGRNAFIIMQSMCFFGADSYKIAIGVHSGTSYSDCSNSFIDAMNRVIDCYANGTVFLEAPLIAWNKIEIFEYCLQNELPLDLTYSCEKGGFPPCGTCLSCKDRKVLGV